MPLTRNESVLLDALERKLGKELAGVPAENLSGKNTETRLVDIRGVCEIAERVLLAGVQPVPPDAAAIIEALRYGCDQALVGRDPKIIRSRMVVQKITDVAAVCRIARLDDRPADPPADGPPPPTGVTFPEGPVVDELNLQTLNRRRRH